MFIAVLIFDVVVVIVVLISVCNDSSEMSGGSTGHTQSRATLGKQSLRSTQVFTRAPNGAGQRSGRQQANSEFRN